MRHIDLRTIEDDDVDAIFEMMRDPASVEVAAFTAEDPDDREAFDAWLHRLRTSPGVDASVITDGGGFAGTAAAFDVDDDREVTFWIVPHARGRGVGTQALRLLVAREPVRPLYARVAAHNIGSITVLERNGFTELSRNIDFAPGVKREVEEIVYVLVPGLDGV